MSFGHGPMCVCPICANNRAALRNFSKPEYDFEPKFAQELEPPTPTRTLHQIGRVRLDLEIYRKVKHYSILVDGVLAGHSRDWPHEAFRMAREKFQKPSKKVVGEIMAYRGWRLVGDLLKPLNDYSQETWHGPVAIAHEKPGSGNSNGLYAIRLDHTQYFFHTYGAVSEVHGIIGLFGRVVELERGYRAEKAIIRVLRVVPPVGDMVLKALEERYQCQVFRQKRS